MQNRLKRRRSKSPFRAFRNSHSPSPSSSSSKSGSGSGRSTPSNHANGIAAHLEESKRASPVKDSPSHTPADRRSLASSNSSGLTPSSTMDGLGTTPSLPKVLHVRKCTLRKKPPDDPVAGGWGFVLRGTTSEFRSGTKVYTCHVETVKEDSAAMNAGIKEGDQIIGIDGTHVKDFQHSTVVKIFQNKDKLELTLLPAKFKASVQVRVTDFNKQSLSYMWCLTMSLQSLEIINVRFTPEMSSHLNKISLVYLPCLRHLAINHCAMEDLYCLEGLQTLRRLESLSLAHNFLSYEAFHKDGPLSALVSLKKLDLGYNLLTAVPPVIISSLSNLETLVLVENNISELPLSLKTLKKLTTLCIDGNLLTEVDTCLELVSQLKMVTMADNQLDTEPYCIKHQAYVITSIEGNPYIVHNGKRQQELFLKRTMSARGVFKSHENTQIKRISSVFVDPPTIQQMTTINDSPNIIPFAIASQ